MIGQMQKIYNEVVWSWVAQRLADARQPTMRLNIIFLILLKGSLPTFDIIGQEKENTHSQKEDDCSFSQRITTLILLLQSQLNEHQSFISYQDVCSVLEVVTQ